MDIPYGYCQCGCGEKAPVARQDHPRYGWVKGEPLRYVRGHNNRGRYLKHVRYAVEDRGFSTPCWIWQLRVEENGYGSITTPGSSGAQHMRAHRFMWEQATGRKVPDGMVLDHLCRVRACVNPDHLDLVDHPENCRRGAGTKLTVEKVRAIRAALKSGVPGVELADEYGVSQVTICNIKHRHRWADV